MDIKSLGLLCSNPGVSDAVDLRHSSHNPRCASWKSHSENHNTELPMLDGMKDSYLNLFMVKQKHIQTSGVPTAGNPVQTLKWLLPTLKA